MTLGWKRLLKAKAVIFSLLLGLVIVGIGVIVYQRCRTVYALEGGLNLRARWVVCTKGIGQVLPGWDRSEWQEIFVQERREREIAGLGLEGTLWLHELTLIGYETKGDVMELFAGYFKDGRPHVLAVKVVSGVDFSVDEERLGIIEVSEMAGQLERGDTVSVRLSYIPLGSKISHDSYVEFLEKNLSGKELRLYQEMVSRFGNTKIEGQKLEARLERPLAVFEPEETAVLRVIKRMRKRP